MIRRRKQYVMLVVLGFILAVLYWVENSYSSGTYIPGSSEHLDIHVTPASPDAPTPASPDAPDVQVDKKDLRSSYLMKYQPYHFVIQDDFTLPMPRLTLPIYELIQRDWMEKLRDYLYQIPPNSTKSHISIVACDSKFKDVLLNWLISAMVTTQPPLSHILIFALDRPLHSVLVEHGFDSVLVDPQDLLSASMLRGVEGSIRKAFYIVMVLRLTAMRLMNHWGYGVANYDTDAIILKNPEQLFYVDLSSSDLIGSRGKFPVSVRAVFGFTLCAGVFMVKSTPEIEEFWKIVSKVGKKSPDDQERLNIALTRMDLVWDKTTTISENKHWTASNRKDFTATVLDVMHVCRRNCKRKEISSYYVWHHGGKFSEGKVERARLDHVWLLRKDWMQVAQNSTAVGIEWLGEMRK